MNWKEKLAFQLKKEEIRERLSKESLSFNCVTRKLVDKQFLSIKEKQSLIEIYESKEKADSVNKLLHVLEKTSLQDIQYIFRFCTNLHNIAEDLLVQKLGIHLSRKLKMKEEKI